MEKSKPEWLNKGSTHYKGFKIEPLEFIMANNLPFWMGNVVKYVCRADMKDGITDLEKAKHYIEVKIEELQRSAKGKVNTFEDCGFEYVRKGK